MTLDSPVRAGLRLGICLLLASVVVPEPAYGYIDPISGSIILQVVAAGFLAAVFSIKGLWRRVLASIQSALARVSKR